MANKICILLVDDEIDFLETIANRLEMRGFDVTKAANGMEAIEAAKKKKYDIALLDLKMPGLNGFEVLEILKKEHKYIEVIILTAHGSIEAAFETSKIGAFGFLTKPYNFDILLDMIKDAYQARLKKKYNSDEELINKMMEKVTSIPLGNESSLDILDALRSFDDNEK